MDFLQLAADRYSVRSFSDRPIEPKKMEKILEAGQLAPTAVNFQPQKIYILRSKEALYKIRSLTRFAYDAPVFIQSLHPKSCGGFEKIKAAVS